MAKSTKILSAEEIRTHLLKSLQKHGNGRGLVYSDLAKKCGKLWKRSLAKLVKSSSVEAGAIHVRDFVYQMWAEGLVFLEPPRGRQQAPRIWDMSQAIVRFPNLCTPLALTTKLESVDATEALKAAYQKHFNDHAGGFVPIFKVRRSLGWTRSKFDNLVKNLNESGDPLVELHEGDPHDYTEQQQADSIELRGRTYLRMRWRAK